jgi:hypothetical protein
MMARNLLFTIGQSLLYLLSVIVGKHFVSKYLSLTVHVSNQKGAGGAILLFLILKLLVLLK